MKKSRISWLLAVCLSFSFLFMNPAEANTTNVEFGKEISGTITKENNEQIYQVNVKEGGKLTLNVASYFENIGIVLISPDGKNILNETSVNGKKNDPKKWSKSVQLESGTYTIKLKSGAWGDTTGDFTFTTEFNPANNNEVEPNDGTEIAQSLKLNEQTVKGFLSWSDSVDYYQVEIKEAGKLTVDLSSYIEHINVTLQNSKGNKVWDNSITYGKENDPKKWTSNTDLEAGTYFIQVNKGTWGSTTGVYTLSAEFQGAGNNEIEPNNGSDIAQPISLNGENVKGFLSWNDDQDYYTIQVDKSSTVSIGVSSYTEHIDFILYNEDKKSLDDQSITYGKENDPKIWSKEYQLEPGTYYILINKGAWGNGTGKYTLYVQDSSLVKKFKDVSGNYQEPVAFLVREQITNGLTSSSFGVSNKIKRVDAAVMIAKALKLDTKSAKDAGFEDVPDRAKGAINALVQKGIVNGKTKTRFGSSDNLTRGEMALILTRAYDLDGTGVTITYKDVTSRYAGAVKGLVKNNITQGKTTTRFGTSDPITRGEMAIFLYRIEN